MEKSNSKSSDFLYTICRRNLVAKKSETYWRRSLTGWQRGGNRRSQLVIGITGPYAEQCMSSLILYLQRDLWKVSRSKPQRTMYTGA